MTATVVAAFAAGLRDSLGGEKDLDRVSEGVRECVSEGVRERTDERKAERETEREGDLDGDAERARDLEADAVREADADRDRDGDREADGESEREGDLGRASCRAGVALPPEDSLVTEETELFDLDLLLPRLPLAGGEET